MFAPITIASNTVYAGSTDGHLYALDTSKGQLRWKYKVDGSIYSAAVLSDSHVYFNSVNGSLFAVK